MLRDEAVTAMGAATGAEALDQFRSWLQGIGGTSTTVRGKRVPVMEMTVAELLWVLRPE